MNLDFFSEYGEWKRQEVEFYEEVRRKKYDLQIRTCVGRAEKEQWAVSEPNIQSTSEEGTKRKKSVDEDKAPCPQKIIKDNKRVKLGKNIWINSSITAKTATI